MAYTSTKVAREMLETARKAGRSLTPLELIKLTYLAHGWSLGLRNVLLVSEQAEAWQYGPVYPELYHALKRFRASAVTSVDPAFAEFGEDEVGQQDKQLLEAVFEAYKGLNGIQLSALTHQPNTPWAKAWERPGRNTKISNDEIAAHFKALAEQRGAAA